MPVYNTINMKFRAYTFLEQIIVIIVIGILSVVMLNIFRPKEIQEDALIKAAKGVFIQIDFATKMILAKNTNNYNFTRLVDSSGQFSIESTDLISRLTALYQNHLLGLRNKSLSAEYSSRDLTNGTTFITDVKPSSFDGFIMKNGSFVGFKSNGNCTTTIDYIYDPSTPEKRERENVCALIFIDVNNELEPNILGIDQYIIGIGKFGVK